jgi:hydroxyacylglutathione hydrolase
MEQLAPDLHVLPSRPAFAFNAYLMGGVLVDAGIRRHYARIRRGLGSVVPTAHALTHGHSDHQGSTHALCEAYGIELWAPAAEADRIASGETDSLGVDNVVTRWQQKHWRGPGHPVARRLHEGDEVGGFVVLDTPGHSPGHVSYWRQADRTLVAGDVLFGRHPLTGRPGLHEPPRVFTPDPARNRVNIRRLAALEPRLVCFGHGRPWRDPEALQAFAAALPAD